MLTDIRISWFNNFYLLLIFIFLIICLFLSSFPLPFSSIFLFSFPFPYLKKKRLPSLGKNTESLGELWLGLLRFYTEEFDFKEYVISIRQKKLLTTFEKQWTSKCIAIEGDCLYYC